MHTHTHTHNIYTFKHIHMYMHTHTHTHTHSAKQMPQTQSMRHGKQLLNTKAQEWGSIPWLAKEIYYISKRDLLSRSGAQSLG